MRRERRGDIVRNRIDIWKKMFFYELCIILFENIRSIWIFRNADSSPSLKLSLTRSSSPNSIKWICTASKNGQSFPTCSPPNKSILANSNSTSKLFHPSVKITDHPLNAETNPPCLTNPERILRMIQVPIPLVSTPAKHLEVFDLRGLCSLWEES